MSDFMDNTPRRTTRPQPPADGRRPSPQPVKTTPVKPDKKKVNWPAVAGIIVAMIVGLMILMSVNAGSALRLLIESAASQTFGVRVTMGSFQFDPAQRTVRARHVMIASPDGFRGPPAATIGLIAGSLGAINPTALVFDNVRADDVRINLTANDAGAFNVAVLLRQALERAGNKSAPIYDNDITAQNAVGSSTALAGVAIGNLQVTNARITVQAPSTAPRSQPVSVPQITLSNVGTAQRPASADRAMAIVFEKITQNSVRQAIDNGLMSGVPAASVETLETDLGLRRSLTDNVMQGVEGLTTEIKSLFEGR